MNRDELLEAVFEAPADQLAVPRRWISLHEPDPENAYRVHVRSLAGLDYQPVVVRRSFAPGAGVGEVASTIRVARLLHVCTDPDHRGQGYASRLVRSAHEQAATHRLVCFAAVLAPADVAAWFERQGYGAVDDAPPGFLVYQLRDDEWPDGTILLPGWQ